MNNNLGNKEIMARNIRRLMEKNGKEGGIKYNDVRRGKQRYLLHFTVRADVKNCKLLPYFCPTKNSPPDGSPRGLFRKE